MQGSGNSAFAVPTERPGGDRRSGAGGALLIAGGCAVGLVLVWTLAELLPFVQAKDALVLHEFERLGDPGLDAVGSRLLDLLEPEFFLVWAAAILYVAIARRRLALAAAAALVMVLAPLTSELLKHLVAHTRVIGGQTIPSDSWPSGHSTAALTLALCAALVVPARARPCVAGIGVAFAATVGCLLLILGRHLPSDVLAGYLVATFWMAVAMATLRAEGGRR